MKMTFNLDDGIHEILRVSAFKEGKTMTQIITELLVREIEEKGWTKDIYKKKGKKK